MKRFSEQLQKKSQTVRMSAAERRDLRERLVSYMEYHPLPKANAKQNTQTYLESESVFSFIHFNTPHVRGFMAMFGAFVLIIVPIVAEKSVPGDILYPVKVNFTEEIRSTLTVSPYAKIELETRLLERRISEARLLASEGKLTPEVEEGVVAAVKTHSNAARSEIAMLRENDSDEAAIAEITFGSALSVQAEMLEGTFKKAADSTGATATSSAPVNALAYALAEARKGVEENQSKQNPSYEKMIARIETETTRAYELFADVREIATSEEVSDVERRLQDIERRMDEAMTVHAEAIASTASTTDATLGADVALLRSSLSDLQKLISFMTHIDVRENVTVEELVPVTPTDEEIRVGLQTAYAALGTRVAAIEEVVSTDERITQTEKIEVGLVQVADRASTSKAALASEDFALAQSSMVEAAAYLDDLEKMILFSETLPVVIDEEKASTTESVEEESETPSENKEDADAQVE